MSYWKFDPTDDRDFILHVNDGLAYRETMPSENPEDIQKAYDLLFDAKQMIEDKTKWMPFRYEHEGGLSTYYEPIKAVDKHGDKCRPTYSNVVAQLTLLGAIEASAPKHYTPDSLRIGLNAMQLVIEGWISLGNNHDERRQQEQKQAICGLEEWLDDADAMHNACLSALDEAMYKLADELPPESDESPDDDTTVSMRGATAHQVLSADLPPQTEVSAD